MVERYKIVYQGGTGELVEKKSRFIADIKPVADEEEALAFVEEIRRKYWDARHHCFAYVIGDRGQTARCSDDGEPSQTAGTGGLVRAYSGALKEGLKACVVVEKKLASCLEVRTDYNGVGKIQYIAAQSGIDTLDSQYTDQVLFTFLVPAAEEGRFKAQLTEGTNGRASIKKFRNQRHFPVKSLALCK